ncbi:MAG: YkgJ family cysteine cluster protein [Promethearchaeota archaeon]
MENKPVAPKNSQKIFRFKCVECGECCSNPDTIVNLTYSDILRMQYELNYGLQDFLRIVGFYKFDHDPTPEELEKMVIPPILTTNGQAFLGLRKGAKGKCIFLSKKNKCKIYAARPSICRTFPFHFHSKPIETPKAGLDIKMDYAQKALEYCPGVGGDNPPIDPEYWMDIGKDAISNILKEVILIKKWNTAVETNKIQSLAENYLRIILNMVEETSGTQGQSRKKTKKKSYQASIREKLKTKTTIKKK